MVWRGCLVLDSYESGMERMSCFRFIRDGSGMERMSCFRFIREVVWRGCLVLDSYDEWYGEDVLF